MVSRTSDRAASDARPAGPLRRAFVRCLRGIAWSAVLLCAGAAVLLAVGFLWFVERVPEDEVAVNGNVDGIVALTGGASRIADAMELMAAGRGKRPLISGAHRDTTLGEISRLNPEYARVIRCCVDFDRSVNTLGNAVETRRWAQGRNFRSLIVVTSNYHMPRALAEIAHQLPEVKLVPFPVVTERQGAEPWWASGTSARLMLSEYMKYVVTMVRIALSPTSRDQARHARVPG